MNPKSAHQSYRKLSATFYEVSATQWILIYALSAILLAIVLFLVVTQIISLYSPAKYGTVQNTDINHPTPTQGQTFDTSTWKTYKISSVGMEFKLPPELYSNGNLQELIHKDPAATFCLRFTPISPSFLDQYNYAGFCYGDKPDKLRLGAAAYNYHLSGEGGGGITVSELQGFTKKNGKYYSKFNDRLLDLPKEISNPELTRQFINNNNVEILRIKGDPNETREHNSTWITIGKGWMGAIINTHSSKYPGFSLQIQLVNGMNEEKFDQILSTFNFTE